MTSIKALNWALAAPVSTKPRAASNGSPVKSASRKLAPYLASVAADPCAYCDGPATVIDHIVPQRHGGENDWTNYTPACVRCNSRKSTTSLLAYLLWESYDDLWREIDRIKEFSRVVRSVGT